MAVTGVILNWLAVSLQILQEKIYFAKMWERVSHWQHITHIHTYRRTDGRAVHVSHSLLLGKVKKKYNVKCILVQALRLCTGRTAHRGSRGIALLFLDHGIRRGERSASRPGRSLPPGKTRYPLYRRLGGPQGRSGRAENLVPTEIRSTDRPARSQSLYRLSYPAHLLGKRRLKRQWGDFRISSGNTSSNVSMESTCHRHSNYCKCQ